jgi:sugar lactone lactonase YvrE
MQKGAPFVAIAFGLWACSSTENPGGDLLDASIACTAPDAASSGSASADAQSDAPADGPDLGLAFIPTFTTLFKSPLVIEGLTADPAGNLYAAGRAGTPSCPVYRVSSAGVIAIVGNITAPCSPNGLTFDRSGDLFIGDGDKVYKLTPDDQTPPTASVFASGVPGANGLAFDKAGNLWVSDGTTGQGRVWKVSSDGTVTESFRVQPLANSVNVTTNDAGVETGGIGRDPRALPPGSLSITPTTRAAGDTLGSVPIVANGLAFAPDGTLFIADTARGAIWRVRFGAQDSMLSGTGCDTTFAPNTLCLDDVFVAHPALEGLDGIALDTAGRIWGVANERNALVIVSTSGGVREVFRNPVDATTQLRNSGPLEFPTSPFLAGGKLCITQSDNSRRDNFPNSAGEVKPTGPELGKISCLDRTLPVGGLALPIQ